MSCSCGASSTFGAGCGCGWSNCQRCSPCPSCNNAVPETCEPLGITGAPNSLVVEDSAYCKKTIQTPETAAVLIVNADTGRPEWNGGDQVCLPDLPTNTGTAETRLVVQDSDCLRAFKPDYTVSAYQILLANQSLTSFSWQPTTAIYPSIGCGVLTKDCGGGTANAVTWQGGTEGQVLTIDSDLNPRFSDLSGLGLGVGIRTLTASNSSAAIVNITATNAIVFDSSGNSKRVNNVSVAPNIGLSGAGGLDTGSEASSTWYYFYIIYDSTNLTVNGLFSLSASSPTLPTGYDYYRVVGAVRNNGSSNFINFFQAGENVWIDPQNVFNGQAGSTSYVTQSISTYVPPVAVGVKWTFGENTGGSDAIQFSIAGNSSGLGREIFHILDNSGGTEDSFGTCASGQTPLVSSQTLYWKTDDTASVYRLDITGYTLNF